MSNKAAFHLSELTDQPIPIVMRISLLIKTNHPHQSNPKYYAQQRWFFSKTSWKKAYFTAKMSGPAIVRPASSDRENYICPKVSKMGSKIGHRIDYNGVGALRRQRQLTQVLPTPPSPPGGGLYHTFRIFTFSEKHEHLPSTLPS